MHILPKKWITILQTKLVTISDDVDKIAEFPKKLLQSFHVNLYDSIKMNEIQLVYATLS